MVILKKPITMNELCNKYELFKTTVDTSLLGVPTMIIHEFKKYPDKVAIIQYLITNGILDKSRRDVEFVSYYEALRLINKRIKANDTVEGVEANSLKGFKTATYDKKGHADGIIRLENSVRNMW